MAALQKTLEIPQIQVFAGFFSCENCKKPINTLPHKQPQALQPIF